MRDKSFLMLSQQLVNIHRTEMINHINGEHSFEYPIKHQNTNIDVFPITRIMQSIEEQCSMQSIFNWLANDGESEVGFYSASSA